MDWIYLLLVVAGVALATLIIFIMIALRIDLDQLGLRKLEKQGVRLQEPQALEFVLLFPQRPSAERAAQALGRNQEYKVEVTEKPGSRSIECRARRTMVPELKQLHRIRERMYSLSRPQGGTYEGWELGPPGDRHDAA
jgi:Regulator of ribonuclease activity B